MTQRLRWAAALFAISLLTTPTTFGQIYSEPSGRTWANAATWVCGVVPTQGDQLPGQHRIRWNAENHASGVYFYPLTQGHRSDTRAFVLLK